MDKTKHGLRKYHFWLVKVRVYGGRREEEEEKRRRRNHAMKCLELLYGIICWNCLEHVWNSCLG